MSDQRLSDEEYFEDYGIWPVDYDDDEGDCSLCGGDGDQECHDWIQCMAPHTTFQNPDGYVVHICACIACGGTGRAKDQTIW